MDFALTDEQKMLADGAARYVRERCDLESRRKAAASEDGFSRRHWRHFADQGWLALTLPEAAGGLEMTVEDMSILVEELGRGLVCEPLVDSAVTCAHLLSASGSEAARAILADIATGEAIVTLAHLEEGDHSEYDAPVASRAERIDDGWTLSGTKTCVFYGASATHFVVSARNNGDDGYGLFLVAADADGIRREGYSLIDGTRAADVHFDNVRVPASALLHEPATAATVLESALDRAVVIFGAGVVGSMEAVLELTSEYLKTREQYGKPLASFQALKHRMSEMLVETEQARSALYSALAAIDSDDGQRRRRAISGAKALIAQSGHFVIGEGIQLHGGIGVTEEYAVGHHFKALIVYDKRFGDSDFHIERCGQIPAEEPQAP
jgi:alkylation response protein AidB-like acyl-CoA dehydrogenase